jgi:dimethylargininase
MVGGLTSASLGLPDYPRALAQHRQYIEALQGCGLEVLVLDADEAYPDSTFVEDSALLLPQCAVITRPAAPTRRGETTRIRRALERFFPNIESITAPGTLDGGDVMQVGQHYFIGISARTNREGARQLMKIVSSRGMSSSTVPVSQCLHLKTGVTCVAERTLLARRDLAGYQGFTSFTVIPVNPDETGAANCLAVNGTLLMPAGFPRTRRQLVDRGLQVLEVDISEFAKLDGGLTCLSLRF